MTGVVYTNRSERESLTGNPSEFLHHNFSVATDSLRETKFLYYGSSEAR